jgi:hypothetical protein
MPSVAIWWICKQKVCSKFCIWQPQSSGERTLSFCPSSRERARFRRRKRKKSNTSRAQLAKLHPKLDRINVVRSWLTVTHEAKRVSSLTYCARRDKNGQKHFLGGGRIEPYNFLPVQLRSYNYVSREALSQTSRARSQGGAISWSCALFFSLSCSWSPIGTNCFTWLG